MLRETFRVQNKSEKRKRISAYKKEETYEKNNNKRFAEEIPQGQENGEDILKVFPNT